MKNKKILLILLIILIISIILIIVINLRTETETPTPSINWPTYILNQSYRDTLHLKMITYQLLSKEF